MNINFVEVNADKIISELIQDFEARTGEILAAGDQRRQFLQGFGYVFAGLLNDINTTGRSNLLRYANGDTLDALGELLGVLRLQPQAAKVTLKFKLSGAQAQAVTIEKCTRVTPDGKLFFATSSQCTIESGQTEVTVIAQAVSTGAEYNGFVQGQINKIVDGISYVSSVVNITTSNGGTDIESDDNYRTRIQSAPFSYSTAGAAEAYKYLARSASSDVGDVSVFSPSAGTVKISVVKKGGIIPETTDSIITAITDACNDKTKRPLTDNVSVFPAISVNSTIDVQYWISTEDLQQASSIQSAVTEAVNEYKLWQTEAIGRDINPDKLRKLMLNAGAEKINITAPTYTAVNNSEVAQFTATNVVYKGTCE